MDGLECKELHLSKIKETYDFRMESEFYKKEYIEIQKMLEKLNSKKLNEGLAEIITDGTHYTPDYKENGIPFLSALNIQENYLDINVGYKYISFEQHKELSKRVLPHTNDVLLRKVGVGMRKACVVPEKIFEFSIFVSIALIRPKINPYLLSTYINSKYGQAQLLRFNKGISQPDLHLEDIWRLLVPTFSDILVDLIEKSVKYAEKILKSSIETMKYAESMLNAYLKIDNENFINRERTIKLLSRSFLASGRLDAEYYQSKYDILFNKLSEFKTAELGGIDGVVDIKKSIEPGSEYYQKEGIPFIRVSDVDKFEIRKPAINLPYNIVANTENLYPKKDTILFSKDGSVGIAYKVQEDMEAITSGALLHLTVKDKKVILPDYLTLVLNSPIVQMQAERDSNGAIIQHWKPSDIEKVVIPLLDMEIQKEITAKVQEAIELRKESKRFLECAVKAVEMAVESDENTAVRWLEMQL